MSVRAFRVTTGDGGRPPARGLLTVLLALILGGLGQVTVAQASPAVWSLTPNPAGNSTFYGVSCVRATNCVAVGSAAGPSGRQRTGIQGWNGTKWSPTRSPDEGTGVNTLYGVSCFRPSNCMAVGSYYVNATTDLTLVEAWTGRAWSIIPSPNQGTGDNLLLGVSCASAAYCVAVGDSVDASNIQQTLVEIWNGRAWAIVPSPNQGSSSNDLNAVSCDATTHCVAVGDYVGTPITGLNLVESWNGTSWSITSSPDQSGDVNGLFGVWCTSSTDCKAVGFAKPAVSVESESVSQTLLESWDGSSWSITPTPDKGSGNNNLGGVTCTGPTTCVAVGLYVTPPSMAPQNLVETWDGSVWSIVPSPNQGAGRTGLSAVSCTDTTNCLAIGKNQELVYHRPSLGRKKAGRSR